MTFRHGVKIHFPMDQTAIWLYLHMRGISLDAIHEDLMRLFGENAVAYSTVMKYVRSA
jgi:hypothetical protein